MKDFTDNTQNEFTKHPKFDDIALKKDSAGLTIVYRWRSHGILLLIFFIIFCGFWIYGSCYIFVNAVSSMMSTA